MAAVVAVVDDVGQVLTSIFRGKPSRLAAAASVVGGDDCCYCSYRKSFGPGRYPGDTPPRSKGRSCKCKLVAPAGDVAVDSAGVMIAVGVVCSGLFGRLAGLRNHCFVFGVLDLLSES